MVTQTATAAWLTRWTFDAPLVLVIAAGIVYWAAARRRAASGRRRPPSGRRRRQAVAFYAGLASIVLALNSPIDHFAKQLFWVHMLQHILLLTVAAPLIVTGAPWLVPLRLLPLRVRGPAVRSVRRGGWATPVRASIRWFGIPVAAWLLFNVNLWLWHLPSLYNLTLRSFWVHNLEHLLFLVTGIVFWAQVIDSPPLRARLDRLWRVGYVTAAAVSSWLLGVVLTFAPHPLYAAYVALPSRPGGISALTDQQLAAGMMWGPGSVPFAISIFVVVYRWLADEERKARVIEPVAGNGHLAARDHPATTS